MPSLFVFVLAYILTLLSFVNACSLHFNSRSFEQCSDLPFQGAALAWTYNPNLYTLDVGFSGTMSVSGGWVSWGINPTPLGPVMNGSSVLLAFSNSSGVHILQYRLTDSTANGVAPNPGSLDITVLNKSAYIEGSNVTIFAKVQLKSDQTKIYHIWNKGPGMNGEQPMQHLFSYENLRSGGVLDLSDSREYAVASSPHQTLKNRHGAINVIGWGILLPLGVISARYLRQFEAADPAWFYIHASFQSLGYLLGFIGWAIGLKLGSYSKSVVYLTHFNIGTAIFVLASLQILSVLLRPSKDHKYRKYWNIYHHTIGYLVILMIVINIYKGFLILQPHTKWRNAYGGILAILVLVCLVLEILTWVMYFKNRKMKNPETELDGQPINHTRYVPRQDEN